MTHESFDVAIVGAGIVGAACADECARAGLRTVVIEARMISAGATGACMGQVVVMDDSPAQAALTRYSQRLWDQLAESLPPDCEHDACGTIWIAADDEEMEEVHRKKEFYAELGMEAQILDGKGVAKHEPNLRSGLRGGLRVPGDSVIYPPCAARFLLERAADRGAELRAGRAVVELTGHGLRLADGSWIEADMTVNAAGVWSPELTGGLSVKRRKGHLVITDRYPGTIRHQLVELGYLKSAHSSDVDSVAFNVQPRVTGQILIGSSRQYEATDSRVEPVMLERMLTRAREYMPKLSELSALRAWTGHRPATPDNLPIIGPCPGEEGLFLATGHEGLGITTSLGTARILVDQMLNRPSEIPIDPYLPSRLMTEAAHA